jgi:hypothetical protein
VGRNRTLFSNEKKYNAYHWTDQHLNHNILKVYIFESGATDGHAWGATALAVATSIKLTN